MRLSDNFALFEFERSETARRAGIDNTAPTEVIDSLKYGCDAVLQPLREYTGRSIIISSGYRCPALNRAVGGASKSNGGSVSQHVKGEAADFTITGYTIREAMKTIIDLKLPYDQLILEFGRWIHCSWRPYRAPRQQILYIDTGVCREMTYEELTRK